MKKPDKNFFLGALFFTLAIFCISFLPLLLKKIDLIYFCQIDQLQRLSFIFGFFAAVFWIVADDEFFKSQLIYSGMLVVLFIFAIIYNKFAIFP